MLGTSVLHSLDKIEFIDGNILECKILTQTKDTITYELTNQTFTVDKDEIKLFVLDIDMDKFLKAATSIKDVNKKIFYLEKSVNEFPEDSKNKLLLAKYYVRTQKYDSALAIITNETGISFTILGNLISIYTDFIPAVLFSDITISEILAHDFALYNLTSVLLNLQNEKIKLAYSQLQKAKETNEDMLKDEFGIFFPDLNLDILIAELDLIIKSEVQNKNVFAYIFSPYLPVSQELITSNKEKESISDIPGIVTLHSGSSILNETELKNLIRIFNGLIIFDPDLKLKKIKNHYEINVFKDKSFSELNISAIFDNLNSLSADYAILLNIDNVNESISLSYKLLNLKTREIFIEKSMQGLDYKALFEQYQFLRDDFKKYYPKSLLTFTTDPTGAALYLDSKKKGNTPVSTLIIKNTNAYFEIKKNKYLTVTNTIEIGNNNFYSNHYVLEKGNSEALGNKDKYLSMQQSFISSIPNSSSFIYNPAIYAYTGIKHLGTLSRVNKLYSDEGMYLSVSGIISYPVKDKYALSIKAIYNNLMGIQYPGISDYGYYDIHADAAFSMRILKITSIAFGVKYYKWELNFFNEKSGSSTINYQAAIFNSIFNNKILLTSVFDNLIPTRIDSGNSSYKEYSPQQIQSSITIFDIFGKLLALDHYLNLPVNFEINNSSIEAGLFSSLNLGKKENYFIVSAGGFFEESADNISLSGGLAFKILNIDLKYELRYPLSMIGGYGIHSIGLFYQY